MGRAQGGIIAGTLQKRAYFLARCPRCAHMWVSRSAPDKHKRSVKCPKCGYSAYNFIPEVPYSKADPIPAGRWGERIEKCDTLIRLVILYRTLDGKLYKTFDVPLSDEIDIGIRGNTELRDMFAGFPSGYYLPKW